LALEPSYINYYEEAGQNSSRIYHSFDHPSKTTVNQLVGVDLLWERPFYEKFSLQVRTSLYVYANKDSFFLEGANFNTMFGIAYKLN